MIKRLLTIAAALMLATGCVRVPMTTTQQAVVDKAAADPLAELRACAPLQKPMYYWAPLPGERFTIDDEAAVEFVRLTGTYCLSDWYVRSSDVDRAVATCQLAGDKRGSPCVIGINYDVWGRLWDRANPPTLTGEAEQPELQRLSKVLATLRARLADANKRYGTSIQVGAILYDCEVFEIKADDRAWNDAIVRKYDLAYDIAKAIFPDALVVWYGRGAAYHGTGELGWTYSDDPGRRFDGRNKGNVWSLAMYHVGEMFQTERELDATVAWVDKHGGGPIVPWISLGCGYKRAVVGYHEWTWASDAGYAYSWLLGAELNHPWYARYPLRYGQVGRVTATAMYPGPWDPRVADWEPHFVAYVRGANDNQTLPEKE